MKIQVAAFTGEKLGHLFVFVLPQRGDERFESTTVVGGGWVLFFFFYLPFFWAAVKLSSYAAHQSERIHPGFPRAPAFNRSLSPPAC